MEFCDLKYQYQLYKTEIDEAVTSVMESAAFIKGPAVRQFEQEMQEYLENAVDAVGCSSGTDALLIALMALDVQPGDEIIIPDFTFIATGEVISLLGAVPVFCDIDEDTYLIDPEQIMHNITDKTVGIIPVSLFGQCADMDAVQAIADKHHLWVVEDAAQSFGAEYKGRKSCTMGDISATSFFPAKPLGCYGDGGALFTKDAALSEKIHVILNHGQTQRYHHSLIGINGRLDSLQAAILSVKLKHFADEIVLRNAAAEHYTQLLKNLVKTPELLSSNTSVWAQYTVRHKNRDGIRKNLKHAGIPTAVHYPIPLPAAQAH